MTPERVDLFRSLAVLSEPPDDETAAIAEALGLPVVPTAADYAETFVLQLYPYASVYLGTEGMLGGEARDRVAGFWRALELVPPPEPDHIGALLGLYASLAELEANEPDEARAALRRSARGALLWEHLLSWCPVYLGRVAIAADPAYAPWAELAAAALVEEARDLGPVGALPLALREAPRLPAWDAAAADWITALLAPVRSGLVLTRGDLARAAAQLDVGLRVGERAFILRALLEQDPTGARGWLASEADAAAARHASMDPLLAGVGSFWRERASATASALRDRL